MNTYNEHMDQNFSISKDRSNKRLLSVLLILSLAIYQSALLAEPAPKMNIMGTSLLSLPSEETEDCFFERFSSGAFPGQPSQHEHKKSSIIQRNNSIPTRTSLSGLKKTDKKRGSSYQFLVPSPGENGVILRKYDSLIERVNNQQPESEKTRIGNDLKEASANSNKLVPVVYENDRGKQVPHNPSLEFHNEPADFDIDLTDTGINVRYLW